MPTPGDCKFCFCSNDCMEANTIHIRENVAFVLNGMWIVLIPRLLGATRANPGLGEAEPVPDW